MWGGATNPTRLDQIAPHRLTGQKSRFQCAGLNRQEVGNERVLQEKSSEPNSKALELDDSLAKAHNGMAAYYLFSGWDLDRAEAESQRVIELSPNLSEGHHLRSYVLLALNRDAEALQEQKRATGIDLSLNRGIWGVLPAPV